jgi:uncharacterized membrane protein YbhN (UPF0104 family)/membrane-associated phospholipid phosphatase/tRNA A-37 threonylcarbamoyl transferase component Bud32
VTVESAETRDARTPSERPHRFRDRLEAWRYESFGPASEKPFRRRPLDAVRLTVAAALLAVLSLQANTLPPGEQGLFTYFNSLPSGLKPLFGGLYTFGTMWAVGLVVAAALVGRRYRLALAMLLSGGAAWATARVVGAIVVRDETLARSLRVVTRWSGVTPHFPQARVSIVAAILAAASPYLRRPTRAIGGVLVIGLGLAALYLGVAYPRDVVAGMLLGWGVAALVALGFGSPGGRPTVRQVTASLRQLGIEAAGVHLAPHQPAGSTLVLAHDASGPLDVRVMGRDDTDTQVLSKVVRGIVYKDPGPHITTTRVHQLQLQALAMLFARNNGTRVPQVLAVGKAGPGAALLVSRRQVGQRLDRIPSAAVTDAVLDALWRQVAMMHAAGVVHGRLNIDHVVVTPDGPAIVGFERAAMSASPMQRARDVAELLASTSARVGDERAVDACERVMGREALGGALPVLQPEALDRETRSGFEARHRDLDHRLTALRSRGARTAGVDPPALQQLRRIGGANLAMAIGTLVGIGALMSQIGDPEPLWDALLDAKWNWLGLSLGLSLATNIAYAVALMGCVPIRLPLWPTTECQLAMSFSNLAVPLVGGDAVQVRFLQKQGVDLASAVAAGGVLNLVANTGVQLALFVAALAITPDTLSFQLSNIQAGQLAKYGLAAVFVILAITGILFAVRQWRQKVMPPIVRAASTIWAVLRSPQRLTLLVAGNVGAAALYAFVLEADLLAFGSPVSFWTLLALSIGIGSIAALVPIAGGGAAVSTVGMTGALTALGVSQGAAVAAVLLNQLVVSYIPAVPGWIATRDMLRRNYL